MVNMMCRRLKVAPKTEITHRELQVPPSQHVGLSAELGAHCILPAQAAVPHRGQGIAYGAATAELASTSSAPRRAERLCPAVQRTNGPARGFPELMPFFTSFSRHLPDNIQGKSPTSATSPVLETFFIPFIAIILLIRRPPRLTVNCCYSLRVAALLPSLIFPKVLATFKIDNALPTFHSFISLF